MVSRRTFLKYTGSTMLTLFGFDKLSGISRAIAAIPGGTLDPNLIKKFKTPLFILPAMPKAGKIKLKGGKTADYYEVSTKQFSQQILPTGLPTTTVWGYGPVHSVEGKGPHDYHAPSLTIEAKWDVPVVVKWTNDLKDKATGDYLPHLLPVDPTLHWANPPGGTGGTRHTPKLCRYSARLRGPGADRRACSRHGRGARPQRRLCGGMVPSRGAQYPFRVCRHGNVVWVLQSESERQ